MKTLALLTGSFPPTNIVGALRPFRLAKHIGRNGWKVLVLTQPPKPEEGLDETLLEELGPSCEIKYVSRAVAEGKEESRLKRRVVGTARDLLRKWVKPDLDIVHVPSYCRAFKSLYRKYPADVVLTTSPSHSIHLAGLWIKKNFGLPWVVDFRDPWDDYLKTGVATIKHPVEKYFEKRVIQESDAVISTTNMYTDILSSRHSGISREKFFTITNSFDSTKTSKPQEKSKDKFIICYTGIFYPSKDPYGFFRALRRWFDAMVPEEKRRYRDRLEVHLIGSGDRRTRQVIQDLKLEKNVIFFDRMPHEKAIEKTLQGDLALISTGIGEKTRAGWLPSKLFEYLGCRIPILGLIREGEMAEIIRRTNSGHVLTAEDPAQVGAVITESMNRKFNDQGPFGNGYHRFDGIDQFEEENVMKRFISVIEKVA